MANKRVERHLAKTVRKAEHAMPDGSGARCPILLMPKRTYASEMFTSPWETKFFKMAGTLDGFIDFAVPSGGTYPLALSEARKMAESLCLSIRDVESNCMHDLDSLLVEDQTENKKS